MKLGRADNSYSFESVHRLYFVSVNSDPAAISYLDSTYH